LIRLIKTEEGRNKKIVGKPFINETTSLAEPGLLCLPHKLNNDIGFSGRV
jgi:hypothetical protein